MVKKEESKIIQLIDQSTEDFKKTMEVDEEDPVLTAEQCKKYAEQLIEKMQAQKRKLIAVYEIDTEASQVQQ